MQHQQQVQGIRAQFGATGLQHDASEQRRAAFAAEQGQPYVSMDDQRVQNRLGAVPPAAPVVGGAPLVAPAPTQPHLGAVAPQPRPEWMQSVRAATAPMPQGAALPADTLGQVRG